MLQEHDATCPRCGQAGKAENPLGWCNQCWNAGTDRLLRAIFDHLCEQCRRRRVDEAGLLCWACLIFTAGQASGLFPLVLPSYGKLAEVVAVRNRLHHAGVTWEGHAVYIGGRGPYTDWPEDEAVQS